MTTQLNWEDSNYGHSKLNLVEEDSSGATGLEELEMGAARIRVDDSALSTAMPT